MMIFTRSGNLKGLLFITFLFLPLLFFAQKTITGKVIDADTKEGLVGANVLITGSSVGFITDINSKFELKSDHDIKSITVTYLGYEKQVIDITKSNIIIELKQTAIELKQIIVSANRTKQERKDAPVAMTKIQTRELNDLKANFHGQILSQVSSIHYADFGNEQQNFSIRQPLSFSRTQTIILEDGIPVGPTSLSTTGDINEVNIALLKSVEVIRGPTSSLYGSEAIGGAINYELKNPTLIPTAHISMQETNLGYLKTVFSASNTYNKSGILIGGYCAQRRNGYREHSDMDKIAISLKATHNINYKSKLTFSSTFNKFKTDFAGSLDSATFYSDDEFNAHTFSYVIQYTLRSSLRFDHFWNDKNKTFISVFHRAYIDEQIPTYRIQMTGSYPNIEYKGEFVETDFMSYGMIAQHKKKFNFLNSSLIGGFSMDYTPENYYSEIIDVEKSREGRYTSYTKTGDALQDFQANLMNSAIYVNYELSPLKKIKVLMALRYDRLDYNYNNHLTASDTSGAPDTKNTFDNLSPKIGFTYDLNGNMGFYSNFSVGFAPPLFNQLYKTVKVPVLKPSVYNNYEIGGWLSFMQNKAFIDFAIYLSEGKNEIVEVFEAGATVNKSAGESRHKGIEYSLKYKPLKFLGIRFSGTNALHEFIDDFSGYEGNEMSFAPNFIANAEISYTPGFLKNFRIALEAQNIGDYYMDERNSEKYDGYLIFNLRIKFEILGSESWINILNLTDELYAARASKSYYGNPMNPIVITNYSPGIHRTFVIGIAYNFSKK